MPVIFWENLKNFEIFEGSTTVVERQGQDALGTRGRDARDTTRHDVGGPESCQSRTSSPFSRAYWRAESISFLVGRRFIAGFEWAL